MASVARTCSVHVITNTDAEGEEMTDEMAVAAVMPISAVLGEGTDSDEECVAPFQTPHLFWDCLLGSPRISSPLKTKAMIDSGSHVVIIDSQGVDRLALQC